MRLALIANVLNQPAFVGAIAETLVIAPDAIARPSLPTADHVSFATSSAPESTAPHGAYVLFPDAVPRAWLHASAQQTTATIGAPERTSPLSLAAWPDRIYRPALHASAHLTTLSILPAPEGTVVLDWGPIYPATITRSLLPVSEQLAVARSTAIERTSPQATAIYPDRLDRAASVLWQLPETKVYPQPETTVSIDWQPEIERHFRAPLAVAQPLHVALHLFAPPIGGDSAPTVGYVWYQDEIDRPVPHASRQLDTIAEPQPLLFAWIDALYPDAVVKLQLAASSHMATLVVLPKPERTATLAIEWHPDSICRPFYATSEQLAQALPAPTVQAWIDALYPDAVYRPDEHASRQLDTIAEPQPLVLAWVDAIYPDRIEPRYFPTWEQVHFGAPTSPVPNPPATTFPWIRTFSLGIRLGN